MRTFIIDTDTASDDAVALIMALRDPDVDVAAITTVAGNVAVDIGTRNALYTAELCGSDVPIYRGADRPLLREPTWAYSFHGDDGLGNQSYPPPTRTADAEHAIDALIHHLGANPGAVLVTLGPLTNVAMAIRKDPQIVSLVSRCVIMGGAACTVGNITPAAEFNIYVDPEAANIVFHCGLSIEMVGWEVCRGEANIDDTEMAKIKGFDTALARFAIDCNATAVKINREWLGEPGLSLPDPVAMGVALDPSVVTKQGRHYVTVETQSSVTRGMTVVDERGITEHQPNATVCWAIDIPRWKDLLYRSLQ
jgi:purine nucleosidase